MDWFSDVSDFFTEDVPGFFNEVGDTLASIPDAIGDAFKSAFLMRCAYGCGSKVQIQKNKAS